MQLRELRGLGPKTEKLLKSVGIETPDDLRQVGALEAFIRLRQSCDSNPSISFLYAMVGALEDRDWLDVARNDRESLIMSLEGFEELERELKSEGIEI